MKVHVVLWGICLAALTYLAASTAGVHAAFYMSLVTTLVGASVAGVGFGALINVIAPQKQKGLKPLGSDPFEAIWTALSMAITTAFMALTLNATLDAYSLTIPYGVLILTPLSAIFVWVITANFGGDSGKKLKLRLTEGKGWVGATIIIISFGLAIAITTMAAHSTMANMTAITTHFH